MAQGVQEGPPLSHGGTTGYDDHGRPVPSVAFDDPFAGEASEAALVSARDTAAALIRFAIEGRGLVSAGRRVFALAWLLGELPGVRTQRQLAERLGVTPAAACKLMAETRFYLGRIRGRSNEG